MSVNFSLSHFTLSHNLEEHFLNVAVTNSLSRDEMVQLVFHCNVSSYKSSHDILQKHTYNNWYDI